MKLREYFRMMEGSDLPDDFGRPPMNENSSRVFIIYEDSRGNIKKFLKMSEKLADHFHALSPKFAFAIARAFTLWLQGEDVVGWAQNAAGGHGMDAQAVMKKRGDDKMLQDPPLNVLQNFDREVGGPLKNLLEDKPHYEKQVNAAKTYEDLQKIFTHYRKKTSPPPEQKTIMTFNNGWYWYGPLSPEECRGGPDSEASLMQHCATDHRGDMISLRDEKGYPYVTMTWNKGSNKVFQVKGRQNRAPEERYWPYIEDFWKKFGPKLKDSEISRATPKLAARLQDLTQPDVAMEEKLRAMEALISDPEIRAWPYELDLIVHGVSTWGQEDIDLEPVKKWFTDRGMTPHEVKLTGKTHTVYFDDTQWADDTSIVPPYDQLTRWNAWTIANVCKLGLGNHEIAQDPTAWVDARAEKLQQVYTQVHGILGIPNKKPISIRVLNKPKIQHQVEVEEYADWFPQTKPVKGQEWATITEFFAEHPEVKRGLEYHIARYRGYAGVEQKYKNFMQNGGATYEDSINRYFFTGPDGREYQIKAREGGTTPTPTKEYYLVKAGTKEQVFGEA